MTLSTVMFLNKIKNASFFKKEALIINFSFLHLKLIKILYKEGFIQSYKIKNFEKKVITIFLRYYYENSILHNLKLISCFSKTKNFNLKQIAMFNFKTSLTLFSTSLGLLTGVDCLKKRVGGILYFLC